MLPLQELRPDPCPGNQDCASHMAQQKNPKTTITRKKAEKSRAITKNKNNIKLEKVKKLEKNNNKNETITTKHNYNSKNILEKKKIREKITIKKE